MSGAALVSDPVLAKRNILRAIERRFCEALTDLDYRRGLMKLHTYIRDEYRGPLTIEDFVCLLVAAGYCPCHLTEPAGGRCVGCDNGFPGLFERPGLEVEA